jgi:hypothetical protein
MPFIDNDHMVEQIPAAVANPTLGNTVLPPTAEAGPLRLYAEALHCIDRSFIELYATIKDQVYGGRVIWECLA